MSLRTEALLGHPLYCLLAVRVCLGGTVLCGFLIGDLVCAKRRRRARRTGG